LGPFVPLSFLISPFSRKKEWDVLLLTEKPVYRKWVLFLKHPNKGLVYGLSYLRFKLQYRIFISLAVYSVSTTHTGYGDLVYIDLLMNHTT
jgi:hypothetical protein